MMHWYAVYTKPRMELWARSNLWSRDFEVYLPRYLKWRRHARRSEWVPRPLFPSYLFVRADLDAGDTRRVNTAPGVRYMVSFGDRPSPVAHEIIEEIRSREGEDGLIRLNEPSRFKRGERLRVTGGVLCEQVGLFEYASDERRVIILLNLLGRKVRVHLAASHVSRDI